MRGFWLDFQRLVQQPGEGLLKIIVVNCLLFLVLMLIRIAMIISGKAWVYESLLEQLTLSADIKANLLHPWRFVSYFFVHVEIFHLAFNMMFLYWFGKILQEVVGNNKSVQTFFYGGIMGAIAFILAYNFIPYFERQNGSYLLGASGGVFAIVLAAATLRPNFEVHLVFIGPVRIKYIAGFYLIWSLLETVGTNAGGQIAHLGGALVGFCMGYLHEHPIRWDPLRKKDSPFIHADLTRKKKPRKQAENIDEEELNQILDKISKSGYDSLSKSEKRRLFKASQKNE
ncbi:rhomboid family intramembrane serine protease [Aquirufa regiilacus]|uniref:Rhomboid family intramembrane serine protease n=1 Tax=Aquirufa regiilacus TaxID=3024868 RepID=A0ABU3TSJ2_9BACT|nr:MULTISPECIES: rhomboid family intramembrane serine protease [unclassified Aquirufa]MDT8886501.1 rhomboid family intramembrane serine protease [Aquirufa sp. LEPPI-3A]MDU0808831.1 rhomboid family intramembrane serine protease [Aquirufa sp. LEOWEIH-7C]